jgi:SAM-dependent methyltransferase
MEYHEFPPEYFAAQGRTDASKNEKEYAPFKKYLITFIKALPQNARVLDVGCGAGKTIRVIKTFRPDVTILGTDISDVRAILPHDVEFTQGSAEDLGTMYPAESFDAVICQHLIEHLIFPMPLTEGILKVLKPGGMLFIETPNWTRMFAPFAHFFFFNDYTHVHIYTPFSLRRLLLEFEFTVNQVVTVSSCVWFPKPIPKSAIAAQETATQNSYVHQSTGSRILARLLNPFMRDILIAVATKKGNEKTL